jgi:hypothetical protein
MIAIVVVGVGLIVYSRNEVLHPPVSTANAPTASDHWYIAFGIDICGTVQKNLATNTNLTSTGIRTFGEGLIDVDPGAVSSASAFEGAKATLGNFATHYPGLTLTSSALTLPGKPVTTWTDGEACKGPLTGTGRLVAKVWSSATAKPKTIRSDIPGIRLENGQMIMLAFVPSSASIPAPPSKSLLVSTLKGIATTSPISSSTTTP